MCGGQRRDPTAKAVAVVIHLCLVSAFITFTHNRPAAAQRLQGESEKKDIS
ncbi:hypothetical protein DESC_200023 [Desulfosarcina cetonica]|nr:hypothetical protein DESC_200023 [Desulfosarcina cetonica]